jgi:hypothetical protein
MMYRKKPVAIEAWREGMDEPKPEWLQRAINLGTIWWSGEFWFINTLEGTMKASIDDYIIFGIKGEIYPCKPDIFEATYEHI